MTTIEVSSVSCFAQRTGCYLAALVLQIEDVRVRNYTAYGWRLAAGGWLWLGVKHGVYFAIHKVRRWRL
jgi:hypothetical protein